MPKLGIVVEIDEAYTQCSKAFIRSDLWNPELHIDRDELPSAGAILTSLRDDELRRRRVQRRARRALRPRRGLSTELPAGRQHVVERVDEVVG